jgi:subtilisin family serine protease
LEPGESSAFVLLDEAIQKSIAAGVTYVIAAGNNTGSACDVSPARVPEAITVSSIIPQSDGRPPTANQFGCVDIFAPGVNITVATPTGKTTAEGTSIAAPHVAGVAALYMQRHSGVKPPDVWKAISAAATTRARVPPWCGIGNIDTENGTPELLLHWGSARADGQIDANPYARDTPPCANDTR